LVRDHCNAESGWFRVLICFPGSALFSPTQTLGINSTKPGCPIAIMAVHSCGILKIVSELTGGTRCHETRIFLILSPRLRHPRLPGNIGPIIRNVQYHTLVSHNSFRSSPTSLNPTTSTRGRWWSEHQRSVLRQDGSSWYQLNQSVRYCRL
jgi:hypothetical protein